ncbi:MAG: HAD-IIA family hydrolase [Candidatus Bipolaricaulota bacterium]
MQPRKDLLGYRAFLVDIDGVLTRGSAGLPGAAEALRALESAAPTLLLSNNSTRSRRELAQHLQALGFSVDPAGVLPSSTLAAHYLLQEIGPTRVWVVGEAGLREELVAAGHEVAARPEDAAWLIVGMDRNLTYKTLDAALHAMLAGARFLATNEDATFPTSDGVVPGAGAIVGALRGMGFAPHAVMGKPSPHALEIALRKLGRPPEQVLMIGDRLDTDIAGAAAAGMDSALVLCGVTREADVPRSAAGPTWIAADLAALVRGDARRVDQGAGNQPGV